jgi:hypothetical protein
LTTILVSSSVVGILVFVDFNARFYGREQRRGHITIQGDRNSNKMERLNGEIRDREKVMRSSESG